MGTLSPPPLQGASPLTPKGKLRFPKGQGQDRRNVILSPWQGASFLTSKEKLRFPKEQGQDHGNVVLNPWQGAAYCLSKKARKGFFCFKYLVHKKDIPHFFI